MSKIDRFNGDVKAFASENQSNERTTFGTLVESDDLTQQQTSAYLRGWGIVGANEDPSLEDFNAAMFTATQYIAYLHQMGVPEWNGAQEYQEGSWCTRSSTAYICKTDDHISPTPPESDTTNWRLPSAGEVFYDNSGSGLSSDNVKDAIDEVNEKTSPIVRLEKDSASKVCFYLDGLDVKTNQRIRVTSGVGVFVLPAETIVSLPALTDGTDYKVFCLSDGTLSAQEYSVADPVDSFWVGGFHNQDGEINKYSFYDMNYRPSAINALTGEIDPRGKCKTPLNMWASIYLLGDSPDVDGVSALGATIADGGTTPIIPAFHGGNGTTRYSSFTQYIATEVLSAYGMRLPNQHEFAVLADGTVSGYAVGTDPSTVQFDESTTSRFGAVGASGVMWQWGAERWDRGNGSSGYAWYAGDTNGEGQIYTAGSTGVGASLFGGTWALSGLAGSRASTWFDEPWSSSSAIGARGVCDHFESL